MKLHEVTQGKLEAYEEAILGAGDSVKSAARFNRLILEAARDAGIVSGLPDNLADLKPWQIPEWTEAIVDHITAAKRPPSEGE